MNRINEDQYFMQIAETVALRSTCLRHRIGCVIVDINSKIVSTGYNGAVRGVEHCLDRGCIRDELNIPSGTRIEKCISGDTIIKLLNGTYKTIEELYNTEQNDFYVYSVDTKSGNIVPALARDIRITGHAKSLYKITLDNDSILKCTGDHKILMRDCSYKNAENLKISDSLMPMYYNFSSNDGYEKISNTIKMRIESISTEYSGTTKQIPTHHLVYFNYNDKIELGDKSLVHHVDEDVLNNVPNNLELKTRGEHSTLHHIANPQSREFYERIGRMGQEKFRELMITDKDFRERVSNRGKRNMTKNWNDKDFRERMKPIQIENGKTISEKTNKNPDIIKLRAIGRILKGISELEFKSGILLTSENYIKIRNKHTIKKKLKEKGNPPPTIEFVLKYFDSITEAIEESRIYNHKIKNIEIITVDNEPVYDMSVPNYENFAVDLGDNSCIFLHNCEAVHSEQNALIQAGKYSEGSTLYVNCIPCITCSKMIINAGIKRVVFPGDSTYSDKDGLALLKKVGVEITRIS